MAPEQPQQSDPTQLTSGPGDDTGAPNPSVSPAPSPSPTVPVVQPVKRSGLAGIVDQFRDAVAGTTGSELGTDAEGNTYVRHPNLSHGQQWARIAADAVRGAARGAAVGQGPGGKQRAFAAGVDEADKAADQQRKNEAQMSEEAKDANLTRFNSIKLKHDLAAQEFQLQRYKVKATQEDITFSQEQLDREHKLGSADLGMYKDEADLARVKEANPDFWKHVYANNIVVIPELNEKGERQGIRVFQRIPGVGSQLVPEGTSIKVYQPGKTPKDPPTLVDQVPTIPMTRDEVDTYNAAAQSRYNDDLKNQADLALKGSETREHNAAAGRDISEGHKAQAEADKTRAEQEQSKSDDLVVDNVLSGQIVPERLTFLLGKKEGQQLLEKITARAAATGQEFDSSKLQSYPKLYIDYSSGKTAQTRQNLDTAFKTINDLSSLNTFSSRLPTGGARTAWDNKLTTAAAEIANGLAKPGATATKEEIDRVHKTLNTTFSRQSAIDTQINSLIEQYESIRDKWQQGAPSKTYEAKMPDVGPGAQRIIRKYAPEKASVWWGVPMIDPSTHQVKGYSMDGGKTMRPETNGGTQ